MLLRKSEWINSMMEDGLTKKQAEDLLEEMVKHGDISGYKRDDAPNWCGTCLMGSEGAGVPWEGVCDLCGRSYYEC